MGEVRFGRHSFFLDQGDVVDAAGQLLASQGADIDSLVVIFEHDLPLVVAVLAHPNVLGSSPVLVLRSLVSLTLGGLDEVTLLLGQQSHGVPPHALLV